MGLITDILEADHGRLDRLLAASTIDPKAVALVPFGEFRKGLLRHIGLEEKILFPEARAAGVDATELFGQLRREHSRMVALLVAPPSLETVRMLYDILGPHNRVEEGVEGLYARCDAAIGQRAGEIAERLRAAGEVPVRPYSERRPPAIRQRTK